VRTEGSEEARELPAADAPALLCGRFGLELLKADVLRALGDPREGLLTSMSAHIEIGAEDTAAFPRWACPFSLRHASGMEES